MKKDMTQEEMMTDFTNSFFGDSTQQPTGLSLLNDKNTLSRDILTSLMTEGQPRGVPLDLIQADFPSTPSAIFSNRMNANNLDQEKDVEFRPPEAPTTAESTSTNNADTNSPRRSPMPASSRLNTIMSSNNDDALEEAAKSLQKLYVHPVSLALYFSVYEGCTTDLFAVCCMTAGWSPHGNQ
jgi:hypothetical protein